jgi:hypothetical protein
MTLTPEQRIKLIENYVSLIMEGMDTETLEMMVYDLLVREYETHTEAQIVAEIKELYSDEIADALMEDNW